MENQNNNQQQDQNCKEIKNEFLLELKELASKAPKNISISIIAVENENNNSSVFEGLIYASGKPRKLVTMYQDVFEKVPDLREIISDAFSYYKFRQSFNFKSPEASIFDMIFGKSPFRG